MIVIHDIGVRRPKCIGETGLLLLTDRLAEGRRLQQVMAAVEPCALVGLRETAVALPDHRLIICDAAMHNPAAVSALASQVNRFRANSVVPVLLLARGAGTDALENGKAIGASAVLPAGVSDEQILFTARRLAASRSAVDPPSAAINPAVQTAMGDARAAFHRLFSAARTGQAIATADLERGGNALIAAVRQGRVGAWLDVVRAYDDITYQHCLLVSGLAVGFAMELGMTSGGQRLIAQAALVHDIGKAVIPHTILSKAGPLTATQTAVMRTHAAAGHDMLVRQGGFDPQLLDIVRHHHEYLDGSGYPDRLRGEQVSPLVRLVTICDIYAALIERRPYKKPISPPDALAVLAGMGGKLDAGLLRTFAGMASPTS